MPGTAPPENDGQQALAELKLRIPADLYAAFHRCLWIRVNECGHSPLQVMEEVIVDFLKKHQC